MKQSSEPQTIDPVALRLKPAANGRTELLALCDAFETMGVHDLLTLNYDQAQALHHAMTTGRPA